MRKRVIKLYANYEKEEVWLNQMAANGWHCIDYVLGRYTFEKGEPGAYIYRLQILDSFPGHQDSSEYLEFLAEAGIEHFASHGRWVYLRKKSENGPFELFSDRESRIEHYRKIIMMLLPLALLNLSFGLGLLGHFMPINTLNLVAAVLLATPLISYYRRILDLRKEGHVRE